ncbi:MAG: hypothetical protein M3378_01155 [Actinomycetota bacterium]|nr:hypothetical protein [Actinomycetota bacterium]
MADRGIDDRSITVRNVPSDVHRELAARAARSGQSLQEFVRAELVRLANRPSAADLSERIRARKAITGIRLPPARILSHRDADRR